MCSNRQAVHVQLPTEEGNQKPAPLICTSQDYDGTSEMTIPSRTCLMAENSSSSSYLELLGPLNPHLHQAPIQFPSLHFEVSILVIQILNILLPSVPYIFWFCQQFSCLILYCLICTVSRFLSRQLSNLCMH